MRFIRERQHFPNSAALLCALLFAVLCATQANAADPAEYPVTVLEDLRRSSPSQDGPVGFVISLNGTRCATLDEFKNVILKLPHGSRVTWEVGCFSYTTIPLGPPPYIPKHEFKAWCREHNVTFTMTKYTSY